MPSGVGNTPRGRVLSTRAWLSSAAHWMMTPLNHALSKPSQAKVIASLRLSLERGKILRMSRKRRLYLFLLSLPLWVGLLAALLAQRLLQPNSSFLYPAEIGIAA